MFPDYTDLAKASQRFVIRKHVGGMFGANTWWLYSPNGSRFDCHTFKAALRIAIDASARYKKQQSTEVMDNIKRKLAGQ